MDRKEYGTSLWQALENKNLIPAVKFGKLSVMEWGCISSKGVGVIGISDEILTKEVCFDILKYELIASIKKFGFIDPVNPNNSYYKTMILHINFIYATPVHYTTAPKLLILLPKVLILTLSKICGFI